ncbi:uncharacterized protein LOC122668077 [Telopea speciosissima]|uniref:uncharacterized protein LOC122668077 n=1 Tax=Telopea speciosissima TaxID=54955 RepID=UPI001CC68DDF|nr:uncharacterized protein LOC122668077 [Telopea speciosissima]
MTSEVPVPSGSRIQQESFSVVTGDEFPTGKRAHNISVQTGEEFSLEFFQDLVAPRRVPPIMHNMDQSNKERVGFNFNQNYQLRYEDLTGILGLRRIDSGCESDASDYGSGKGCIAGVENNVYFDKLSRYHKEASASGQRSGKYNDEMDFGQVSQGPIAPPLPISESPHAHLPNASGTLGCFQSGRMKFLCSFGGKILPRPSDGKLRYVGGETRIITIRKHLSWEELVKKTSAICNQPHTIKYQLPGEDLDALISVLSDEDLLNMIEEYNGLERVEGSQRLRIFLISSSESDSPCSFEARASQHSNSEYQYVVAVNGILDPSPRKMSSGQSLVGQLGHNLDGATSFLRDSPTSLHPLEIKDGIGSPNMVGMFSHPAAQFFVVPQNPTKSPNQSPPLSPLPVQQRDSKGVQMQLHDDQLGHSSNESNSPFVTDQLPDNYCIDATGYFLLPTGPGPLMNYHHPNNCMVDTEQTSRPCGVHFHNRRPSRDFARPVFVRNASDLDEYYCERPMLKERAFHSEKNFSHPEDPMGMVSGSNDLVGSHHGMPHARSDSQLQENGGRSIYCLQEGITPSPPLDFETTQSPSRLKSTAIQEKCEFTNPEFQTMVQVTDSIGSQRRVDSPSSSHCPEFSDRSQRPYWGVHLTHDKYQKAAEDMNAPNFMSQEGDEENPGLSDDTLNLINEKDACLHHWNHNQSNTSNRPHFTAEDNRRKKTIAEHHPSSVFGVHGSPQELQVPGSNMVASSGIAWEPSMDIMVDLPQGYQLEKNAPKLLVKSPRIPKDQLCTPSVPINGEPGNEVNVLPPSSVAWSGNIKVEGLENVRHKTTKQQSNENSLTDLLCDSSLLQFDSQRKMGDQECTVTTSVNLAPFSIGKCAGSSINLQTDDPSLTWSSYQTAATDAALKREVTLLDEEPLNFLDEKVERVDHGVNLYGPSRTEDSIFVHSECSSNLDQQIQQESVVDVEDVTDIMPPDDQKIPLESVVVEDVTDSMPPDLEISEVIPHVLDTNEDISSPRITEAESISPENEDTKTDDRDMDGSISDATIAEIEAGIYGLQIIRNADLEELRELGSGTFGTVYHGKWRGTDVAIKRIKKSCFAGRSSEQERLTKDFWREAQILSNLHHPNVVAFYGVVPDGAGGTLATVTEFMVNGSLRHVLLRKDRALDRRKRLIIAMDAAFGMEYLHSKNIVHFDLKCDNLLVNMRDSQRPICKVGDFGLSRIKRNTLVSGGVRGTLPWMAPELLNGSSSRVSEKVDVFSFGIAMWEILTGEEPYANMHCGAIIGGIVNNTLRPPIPERCDPEWRKLMQECWSPEPAERPSFTEITDRLRHMSMALQTKPAQR